MPRMVYRGAMDSFLSGERFGPCTGTLVATLSKALGAYGGIPAARETLLKLRRKHSLSRGHLAALLGVSLGTLRRWEEGTRNPSGAARRLIWLVNGMLTGSPPRNLWETITWGLVPTAPDKETAEVASET